MARAAGGLTAGEVTVAAAAHGLAAGFGDTASVGIGGLTLGGGIGYLVRKHGLTIDQLLGAEVVTADGRVLEVDDDNHPTSSGRSAAAAATSASSPASTTGCTRGHGHRRDARAPRDARDDRRARGGGEAAPEELSVIAKVLLAPPLPFVPPELIGKPLLLALLVHAGPLDEGERAVAPLRALAPPVADFVRAMPFGEMFPAEAPDVPPRAVVRTFFSDSLDEAAAGELLDRLRASTAQLAGCTDPRARRRGGAHPVGGDRVRAPGAAADGQRLRRLRLPGRGSRSPARGPRTPQPPSGKERMPRTSTSSATRAQSASGPPIQARPGIASPRSSAATTRRTSSG